MSSDSTPSMTDAKVIEAAVGIIQRENGLVLLAERPLGKPWAGYWEFPGGKIENDEMPLHALKRELLEELGITVKSLYPWLTRSFDYAAKYNAQGQLEVPAKTVKLHFFTVTEWEGEPLGLESQAISWQDPENLTVSPMLPANTPILTALSLASVYAITNLHDLGEALFFDRLKNALDNGLKMIQVREKQLFAADLLKFIKQLVALAKPYGAKVFLNSNLEMTIDSALELGIAGVHLSAKDLMELQKKPVGMLCGASCHSSKELAKAESLALDYVMLSPVQATLSHPEANLLGWDKFSALIAGYSLPVYALGGMQESDLQNAKLHGAHGIAMLRSVWR
ncbi:MAG: Nudix family hydrolase [Methylotenera sp.]|uniref:Nudix family hydrolase n=1 Tax=Methylotenera sp. TaxID=2051956 RepID=UPI00272EFA06|nr:Nudix family hydrolase [Methylotenera sp.]MDP1523477.1 Nudix family hydrolase [Methylotenera sp.]